MEKETAEETLEDKDEVESYYCDICFENRFVSMTAPCGHSICGVCIFKVLEQENLNNACALCRKEFPNTLRGYEFSFHDWNHLRAEEYEIAARGAVKEGKLDVLKNILELGFDVSNLLGLAALCSQLEMIKFLAKNGANMNESNPNGNTPLHDAAQKGQVEVVKSLAQNGADVNKGDEFGYTPLLDAAHNGHIEVVQFLAEHGANVNKTNENGVTPLHLAIHSGHIGVVKFLAEHGANVNKSDSFGLTPICLAAKFGHKEVVKILAENGADVKKAETNGFNPILLAAQFGHCEVVHMLESLSIQK